MKKSTRAPSARKPKIAATDADLTDDHLISFSQTCEILNCSRMHLYRLVDDDDSRYRALKFPRPFSIGRTGRHERKFFRLGDIRKWIASRACEVAPREAA